MSMVNAYHLSVDHNKTMLSPPGNSVARNTVLYSNQFNEPGSHYYNIP